MSTPILSHQVKQMITRGGLGLIVVLIALGWWAFTNPPSVTPTGSASWSKGTYTGTASLNQTIAMQSDRDGITMVWVDQANRLHFATIDSQGVVASDRFLNIATLFPRLPQLLLDSNQVLHLTWLDGRGTQELYYVQIDPAGRVLTEPLIISEDGETVSAARMALNDQAELEIFWSSEAGLFQATLDQQGQPVKPPALLWEHGDRPSVQIDRVGKIHLAFLEPFGSLNHHVLYATFDPVNKTITEPVAIADTFRRGGQILEGPALGLDTEDVYIFWSVVDSRDVTSFTFYTSFPIANPQPASVTGLRVSGGAFPSGIWPLDGQRQQMITVLSAQVFTRGEREFQTLTGVFSDGLFEGHQLVSASRNPSLKPAVVADKDGNLHAAWLDAGRTQEYRVVYATTNPNVVQNLTGLTINDVVDSLFGVILNLMLVVGVSPFIIVWGIVPLIIILIYFFATGQDVVKDRRTWFVLGLACLIQVVMMILISPDNSRLSSFWRIALPFVLAVPASLVLYVLIIRWEIRSLFAAFFVFVFTHGVLRLILFALLFSGLG